MSLTIKMGNLSTRIDEVTNEHQLIKPNFTFQDFFTSVLNGDMQVINSFLLNHSHYDINYSAFTTLLEKHLDNSYVCLFLGKLYLSPKFSLRNPDNGLRLLQFSATLGNTDAIKDLAANYLKYLDVPPTYLDYCLIKDYCFQAMHLGDPNAIATYLSLCQNKRENDQGLDLFFECLSNDRLSLNSYDQLTRFGFEYLLNRPLVV